MTKISKKDLRRKQIIEAAISVFGNSNFHDANITEIAQKANVAEGTIYQYFKNKEDLFFAIPAQKIEEFCEEVDLQLEGIHDAFNKLRKYTWFYLYHFKTNPAYARSRVRMKMSSRRCC
ncbi:regulatory protein, tetR family [Syntrophus gentianae]|uniref:Regulatory protein, tetR family n=1 Tax=Syntrophus gentianae TaxID=43775 RepID=A0A1H7YEX7_9BACT|nr:TetR/AcrR family transcriptional regulator [Syntrophus gentianae]SEM43877.1 regulatory protein, tetR family [Syntrophus gentianae]